MIEKKLLKTADLRDVQDKYELGHISYSRMVEMLNERITKNLKESGYVVTNKTE